jgi:hypothetical protein
VITPALPWIRPNVSSGINLTCHLPEARNLQSRWNRSRPRVSNDNAYAEALFKTAKYRPEYPKRGFTTLDEAREWAGDFVHWYNHEHRHSGIRYVTPAQRHAGSDRAVLRARQAVYEHAKARSPHRWNGRPIRNWNRDAVVTLNPEKDAVCAAVSKSASQRYSA